MKYHILLSSALLLIFLTPYYSSAQTGNSILQGHSTMRERFIYLYSSTGPLGWSSQQDTIPINQDGEFIFHLQLLKPQNVLLSFGKQSLRLWLKPNTSLRLNLRDSGYDIEGPMGNAAFYYRDYAKETERLFAEYRKKHPGYNKEGLTDTDGYFNIMDSITQGKFDFLDSYFRSKNLPGKKQFIENEKASILYSDLFSKITFSDTAYKNFLFFQQKFHLPGTSVYSFSNQIDFNDSSLRALPAYQRFVSRAVPQIARQMMNEQVKDFSFDLWMDNQMAVIDQLSANHYCNFNNKAIVINEFVKQIGYSRRMEWSDKLYKLMAALKSEDKELVLQDVKAKLDVLVKETKFLKGADAPAFTFSDTAGKMYQIKDFKGKKVYIDVWATWCPHCIELEPAWNKLVDTHKANDSIVFLSVSLDDSRDTWMKFVKHDSAAGIVLHAGDGGWKSSFAINYDITGLPHFLLIDENGIFIAWAAPQPDGGEELEKLLRSN